MTSLRPSLDRDFSTHSPQYSCWCSLIAAPEIGKPTRLEELIATFFPLHVAPNAVLELVGTTFERSEDLETCITDRMSYAVKIRCDLTLRNKDGDERHPQSAITVAIPSVTPSGTCVLDGREVLLPLNLEFAPGVVVLPRARPDAAVEDKQDGAVGIVTDDCGRTLGVFASADGTIKVAIGEHIFPATVLLRALGARTERDLAYMFCSARDVRQAEDGDSIEDWEILCNDVFSREGTDEVRLCRAHETVSGADLKWLSEEADEVQIFRWRHRINLISSHTPPLQRYRLADDIADELTGETIATRGQLLSHDVSNMLRHHGHTCVNVEGEQTHRLLSTVIRTWRRDSVSSRAEAQALMTTAFGFQTFDESSTRRTIDSLLSPPNFSLGGNARKHFASLTATAFSENLAFSREDIVALVARVIEVDCGFYSASETAHLQNYTIGTIEKIIRRELDQSFGLARRQIRTQTRFRHKDPLNTDWGAFLSSGFERRLLGRFETFCVKVPYKDLRQKDGLGRSVVVSGRLVPYGNFLSRALQSGHWSWYGRLCLIDQIDYERLGRVVQLAKYARVRQDGVIETPYLVVLNGSLRTQQVWLSAEEEWEKCIAPADAILYPFNDSHTVGCRSRGKLVDRKWADVDLVDIAQDQPLSTTVATIPFALYTNPLLIAAACQGMRSSYGGSSQPRAIASYRTLLPEFEAAPVASDLHGSPLLTAYAPWYGYTTGNNVVISADVVEARKLEALEHKAFSWAFDELLDTGTWAHQSVGAAQISAPSLDSLGIIRVGASIRPGDTMFEIATARRSIGERSHEFLAAIFEFPALAQVRRESVPDGLDGTVTNVWIEVPRKFELQFVQDAIERILKARESLFISEASKALRTILDGKEVCVQPKVSPNVFTRLSAADLREINVVQTPPFSFLTRNTATNKELDELSCDLSRFLNDQRRTRQYWAQARNVRFASRINSPTLNIELTGRKSIKVGDLISSRHGGRSVIAKIAAREDMPVLLDGRTVDMVINAWPSLATRTGELLEGIVGEAGRFLDVNCLHIPVELGQSQALTLWKCAILQVLASSLSISASTQKVNSLNSVALFRAMQSENTVSFSSLQFLPADSPNSWVFANLMDSLDHIWECLSYHFSGVQQPTQWNALQADERVRVILGLIGATDDGRLWATDGITGEMFDQPLIVGLVFFYRLSPNFTGFNNGRSTGPYDRVSEQPAHFGSQGPPESIDEGMIRALAAQGAAYTLQELLTVKSDDFEGRNEAYQSIVKSSNVGGPISSTSTHILFEMIRGLGFELLMGRYE